MDFFGMSAVPRLYLDHNATAPLRPEAKIAMIQALELTGNASSLHLEGRKSRGIIDNAREAVASLCHSLPQDVIFTSGATEANTLALSPHINLNGNLSKNQNLSKLLVLSTEHTSVLLGHQFSEHDCSLLPVQTNGLLDFTSFQNQLNACIAQNVIPLVSIQSANSETGVLQDIPKISQLVHSVGGLLHVDAVQTAGRLSLDQDCAGADLISISAHKLGGPQGIGALVLKSGGIHFNRPLLRGGGQEMGRRSGTENVAAIAAFGAACLAAQTVLKDEKQRLIKLRDELIQNLRQIDSGLVVFGETVSRLPNTICFAPTFIDAQTALMRFDLAGVSLSSGSACSSGKVKDSHVLAAMGVDPVLRKRALRLSLGWSTSQDETSRFCELYEKEFNLKSGARAA
jgi:cysteine desulfurase